ncbi:uncharacterized protein A4U43_C08F36310 [Asparagus officinalis]|nr:uncharacterized protein A4U43_C08F36310 [Asparagus officinalis]
MKANQQFVHRYLITHRYAHHNLFGENREKERTIGSNIHIIKMMMMMMMMMMIEEQQITYRSMDWMDLAAALRLLLLLVIGIGLGLGWGWGVAIAVVVNYLGIGDGSGVLDDGSADGVDPLLLLLLGVGDEVHGVGAGGELEGELTVEDVLGALDGEAAGDGDDAAGDGGPVDGGLLEPEELPLLQDEPPTPPRLDVLPLFDSGKSAPLRVRPEFNAWALILR